MLRHDRSPVHAISQGPAPHAMLRHDDGPLHSTAHDADIMQSTLARHWSRPEQRMSQWKPGGHVIFFVQSTLPSAQSTMHDFVPRSHDVHWSGHEVGSGASNPPFGFVHTLSSHLPLGPQSLLLTHAS
jgi:hypothetical protein